MRSRFSTALTLLAFITASCGGGGSDNDPSPVVVAPTPTPAPAFVVPPQVALSATEVQGIIARAAAEATARQRPAVIAVVDRVGNILGLFRMTGALSGMTIPRAPDGSARDAQGLVVPQEGGAIAKAITGAYLSSGGNAFTTRTASQIVQPFFPPAPTTVGLESGPLYGVQFSSLPCSDFNTRFTATGPAQLIGPKRSPLGLAADAGGFPLYKNGVLVGGIGVMSDGSYDFDPNILDLDGNLDDETIALAGTIGFDAPEAIRANRISVDGTALRYSDATPADFRFSGTAPSFASINGSAGQISPVPGFSTIAIRDGAAYGSEASGVRASTPAEFANRDAFIFTDGSGTNRFPIRAGTDAGVVTGPLTAAEVRAVLEEAFLIMTRARAQIRRPVDSRAEVTISVVDSTGVALGIVRSPDAPVFGADVSLQKARTAAFFSNAVAASQLLADPSADVRDFVPATRTFLADANAFTGNFAYGNRSLGNIHRPYFPDGEVARPKGPLSRSPGEFSPFSTGLQSALIAGDLAQLLAFVTLASPNDAASQCTRLPALASGAKRLANGIQIFPGSVPIYRGSALVGAIGISGDGIDQDDMIAFLGLNNGATRINSGINNAPSAVRADQIVVALPNSPGVRLRYVSCPFAPFLDTAEQNVCQGR